MRRVVTLLAMREWRTGQPVGGKTAGTRAVVALFSPPSPFSHRTGKMSDKLQGGHASAHMMNNCDCVFPSFRPLYHLTGAIHTAAGLGYEGLEADVAGSKRSLKSPTWSYLHPTNADQLVIYLCTRSRVHIMTGQIGETTTRQQWYQD
jgi:hypothetical protein